MLFSNSDDEEYIRICLLLKNIRYRIFGTPREYSSFVKFSELGAKVKISSNFCYCHNFSTLAYFESVGRH